MTRQENIARLTDLAYEQRVRLVKLSGAYSGNVHLGGDLSMTDALVALYHYGMKVDPKDISMPTRDRFVLSKGHGAVCMYIAMSLSGFFDYDEIVRTYGAVDSAFGMHPCKIRLPGVECSSGSLGQGLPMAIGMALMAKQKKEGHRVYCMIGDGESCEGAVWEAAMFASSYKLGNLVAVVDRNHQMMSSFTDDRYMHMEPYAEKWRAFGWETIEVDGHDMGQLIDALDYINASKGDKPIALICDTIKGKGVPFMERQVKWHSGSLNDEQVAEALSALAQANERSSAK